VAQQSVAAVFLSTVIPGLILAAGYIIVNTFIVHRFYETRAEAPKFPETFGGAMKEIGASFWSALPALGCPLIVLVGIYGGIFTPNEAGAIAAFYTAMVGFFMYREMTLKGFWTCSRTTVVAMGMLCFLLGFGTVFTRLLIREGIGELMTQFILSISDNKYAILFMLNILLLILGMFIDGIPIIIIVVPLVLPLIQKLDVNLVHLGAIVVVNIGLGVVTPPYAISIFLGTKLSNVPYEQLVPTMMIYLLAVGIPVLMLTTYLPALSIWLPALFLGKAAVGIP
jgi:tripartite ATP-independent transporter DctM subunit